MAANPHHIDPTAYLEELLPQASPDLMRQMLTDFINQILSAQADTVCGADYATVSPQRTNTRNGYRHRCLDTRVGSIDVAIPKLRHGAFFPDWLLERRTRTERALRLPSFSGHPISTDLVSVGEDVHCEFVKEEVHPGVPAGGRQTGH